MEWQVVAGLEDGELIAERPDAEPNPAVEVHDLHGAPTLVAHCDSVGAPLGPETRPPARARVPTLGP